MDEDLERQRRSKLGERFRCCICDTPSRAPARKCGEGYDRSGTDWDKPGDLYWCRDCGRYACYDHYSLSNRYCCDCMQKRYPQ